MKQILEANTQAWETHLAGRHAAMGEDILKYVKEDTSIPWQLHKCEAADTDVHQGSQHVKTI